MEWSLDLTVTPDSLELIMIQFFTRSRSPELYRSMMMKLVIGSALLYTFWGPLYPIRTVTASVLATAADLIDR